MNQKPISIHCLILSNWLKPTVNIGIRVDKKSDVEGALLEALNQKDRLVFLDFLTDKKQNVLPMVGNGKGLDEMVLPPHMRETLSA